MCNTSKIKTIETLANEYLNKDFKYNGTTYNLSKLGWIFKFGQYKQAFGRCEIRRKFGVESKKITIGKFLLLHSNSTIEKFEDTIAHECAHALEYEIKNVLTHSNFWKKMCAITGAEPVACHETHVDADAAKYKLVCKTCGDETPKHRKIKGNYACGVCCKKYSNGKYNANYLLELVENKRK